jgi:hypothetical protein
MLHILVNRDGRHLGPYTYDQACQLLAEGKLHTWDIAWPDGSREWVTLDQIDGLADRAFALREQRRAEAAAAATAALEGRPASPTAQFMVSRQQTELPQRNWMRIGIWTAMIGVLALSLFAWLKFLNEKTLMETLERRGDNLTYEQGQPDPFDGIAHAFFNDGSQWERTTFSDGVRHGQRTVWHINGKTALMETYHNGRLTQATSYDFQGQLSGQLQDGTGTILLYWNDTGIRSQELVYENNNIIRRTIWNREGQLLSIIPPPVQVAPPPLEPITSITNTPPPATQSTNTNAPTVIPGQLPNRTRSWLIGKPDTPTPPGQVDKRIDLVYLTQYYTKIVEEFGNPDEIIDGKVYAYRNMRIRNLVDDTMRSQVHFHFVNGSVTQVEALP